eukprot:TRINITY_DN33490_c0_g2_i1.p1 TRINITY_DN33490_c0_g2~~TRINITY_DN33490_c0_g2_i1.p1  ORF type:complete len:240 (-),score=9.57 TRINITY_DN33490_c0_g2_i1:165-884(-)
MRFNFFERSKEKRLFKEKNYFFQGGPSSPPYPLSGRPLAILFGFFYILYYRFYFVCKKHILFVICRCVFFFLGVLIRQIFLNLQVSFNNEFQSQKFVILFGNVFCLFWGVLILQIFCICKFYQITNFKTRDLLYSFKTYFVCAFAGLVVFFWYQYYRFFCIRKFHRITNFIAKNLLYFLETYFVCVCAGLFFCFQIINFLNFRTTNFKVRNLLCFLEVLLLIKVFLMFAGYFVNLINEI